MFTEITDTAVRRALVLPPLLLVIVALFMRDTLPAWGSMWLLAGAIFFFCKCLTLALARTRPGTRIALGYLFAWPGMDANALLARGPIAAPRREEWISAAINTLAGGCLLGLAILRRPAMTPLLTGWLGMVGIILMLHFGGFKFVSLFWRSAGRDAQPMMRAPLFATSLADFWGNRWNKAFNVLVKDLVFLKLVRPLGATWASFAVFLVSGVIHDLVISYPARGGYGWPTAYFLLQGVALMFERSAAGRALGLGRGLVGRVYALTIVAAPISWLFHGPFVERVMVPMLDAFTPTAFRL